MTLKLKFVYMAKGLKPRVAKMLCYAIRKMAARRITALCKCNVIYIRQIRVKHLELTLGYMGNFFNNGSMTIKLHILKVLYGLESHAKKWEVMII